MGVELRPMRWEDLPLLEGWLRERHVAEWWRGEPADLAAVEAKYGACIMGEDATELFIVEESGRPVGMIQRYLFADENEWRGCLEPHYDVSNAAGIDYLLGERDAVGRGVGTAMVQQMVVAIFAWRPVTDIVVTVQQANIASWRILEKAGFERQWAGELDSSDPSDDGPEYLYALRRPITLGDVADDAFADVLGANDEFAATFTDTGLAATAAKGLALLTCMDSRIDPLQMLGLAAGDAKILRNAGARVTDDVLRTLVLAEYLLGVKRVMVVAHTKCRMAGGDEADVHDAIAAAGGPDTRSISFLATTDQAGAVRADVQRIRSWPYLADLTVGGFIYDLETGKLQQVC